MRSPSSPVKRTRYDHPLLPRGWKTKEIVIQDPGKHWREVDFFLRLHGHLPDQNCGGAATGACKYTPDGKAINELNDYVEKLRQDPEYVKKEKAVFSKLEFFLLIFILIFAFGVRLYKINRPIADWHSWRQADTAAVARNFLKEGYTPFIPKYDDMSSQANGLDNPNRFRFVEFPIYNSLIYIVWSITGVNETFARLVTVFISLGSTLILFLLVKRLSGFITAILSASFFSLLPYNIFYSSAILPGPLMVFAILGLYFSFLKWMDNDTNWYWGISSILFANLAILTWPIALLFLFPVLYLSLEKYNLAIFKKANLWIFALLAITPFIAWRFWMSNFPEGIPNWRFLLNEGNIRFKGAFFRWIIAERIGKLILTVAGFTLFIIGLLKKPLDKEKLFYYSWLISSAVYFVVFASGNVRHDYYQVPFVPIAI